MNRDQMKEFGKLALAIFEETLAHHGFKRESMKTERYFCDIVFGNGERYVKISANIHPRDYPPYFNVILGEGGRDFLESDWNSIALWRLKNLIQKTDTGSEYGLENPDKLPDLLEQAKSDLLQFGETFLSGDTEFFRQARSEQNKDRPPYKVHSPDENGKYTVSDEPESVKMKEKYS
jgi:hypothetical protein